MSAPLATTVVRRPDSIRRTSHIDMTHESFGLILDGAARDLVTLGGEPRQVASAQVSALVGPDRSLQRLKTTPERDQRDALIGHDVGAGFRDAVHHSFPDDVAAGSPLSLLLDDLPVATLISGYARLYSGDLPPRDGAYALKSDICSGWRADGTMMVSIREHGSMPVPVGPPAPPLESADDPIGWHAIGRLGTGAMRRRRLVDVTRTDTLDVRAMFRDTHVGPDGIETVLHEYSLTATVDPATSVIISCDAVPRVLPWVECPVAAASATRLAGHPVGEVRALVRSQLRGTSTCTHLNDLLRSLGDVETLAVTLARHLDRP